MPWHFSSMAHARRLRPQRANSIVGRLLIASNASSEHVRLFLALVLGLLAAAANRGGAANAQISDDVVRIGVLNDQSSLYADLGGPGSVDCRAHGGRGCRRDGARQAGRYRGRRPSEQGRHRRRDRAPMVRCRQGRHGHRVRQFIGCARGRAGRGPEEPHRHRRRGRDDGVYRKGLHAQRSRVGLRCATRSPRRLRARWSGEGQDTWFFITVDYAFGHSLEADAASAVARQRRQGAGQRAPSAQHRGFQFLSAAGAGIRGQGRGAGQRRRRHDQRHQAGQRIRIDACAARPSCRLLVFHHRHPQRGAQGRAGTYLRHRVLLGPRRGEPGVVEALLRAAQAHADHGAGRASIPPSATIYARSRRPAPTRRKR